ncbi:response regulator [Rheinheimera maricola]|uniref:Response regulator n=1 Tax=Rheinheimera maricola TaxID=2793282 RepID=A0ABS7X6J2_9GAMM|nr:response regulator [Rheinheimera maricola]MBZ9611163.1 response regulator [Rheinheimera maricola]
MLLCTGLWYQYESRVMQRAQVQQYALGLQYSIRPILANRNQQILNAQLNHLRFASVLPVTAIALYNADGRVLGETDNADLLHQFSTSLPLQGFQLHQLGQSILAVQPLAESVLDSSIENNLASSDVNEYYMLILIEPESSYSVWLLPLLITALIGCGALLVIQGTIQRSNQQLQTDVSLIAHKLSQLKQGQLNSRLDDELVSELMPIKQVLNELSTQLTVVDQQNAESSAQWRNQIQLAEQKQQQAVVRAGKLQDLIAQQVLQLQHLEQFLSQPLDLTMPMVTRAMHNFVAINKLQLCQTSDEQEFILLTDVLAQHLPEFYSLLGENRIRLDVIEGADIARQQLMLAKPILAIILNSLLQIGAQFNGVTELTIALALQKKAGGNHLVIKLSGTGDGMSDLTLQYLTSDADVRYWQQMPVKLLKLAVAKMNAELEVQSLQGLGSSIAISIPVNDTETATTVFPKSLLVFDQQTATLSERKSVLSGLVKNVVLSSDLQDLKLKAQHTHFDSVLIFLPEPEQLSDWLDVTTSFGRSRLICHASPATAAVWREALRVEVCDRCFYLARLYEGQLKRQNIKLLVVDDNQTNLAFTQILLRDQPVDLVTASCGAEALSLCKEQQFELVLLDIQLPDLHGTVVAKQMRQLDGYQQIPILAFTAHALVDEVDSFIAAGMNDVIFKPLDAAKLQQIVHWCSLAKQHNSG